MPHPAPQTTPRKSPWTPARRAAQAEAIRRWKPWAKSTGPKTAAGKARSAQNAAKPLSDRAATKALSAAVSAQARYLRDVQRYFRLRKFSAPNELLKPLRRRLLRQGVLVTARLRAALGTAQLCKNLDFSGRLGQIVNANDR